MTNPGLEKISWSSSQPSRWPTSLRRWNRLPQGSITWPSRSNKPSTGGWRPLLGDNTSVKNTITSSVYVGMTSTEGSVDRRIIYHKFEFHWIAVNWNYWIELNWQKERKCTDLHCPCRQVVWCDRCRTRWQAAASCTTDLPTASLVCPTSAPGVARHTLHVFITLRMLVHYRCLNYGLLIFITLRMLVHYRCLYHPYKGLSH